MGKSLKVIEPRSMVQKEEEYELLVSHRGEKRKPVGSSVRARVVLHLSVFGIGLISSIICLWAMLYTSHSEEVANKLGMNRVANSLENVLSLLAYPFLMFNVILALYGAQQLARLYRNANDPDQYKKHRAFRL